MDSFTLITLFHTTFRKNTWQNGNSGNSHWVWLEIASEVETAFEMFKETENKILFMHKNVFTLPVSFAGSYTEDEPNFPRRNNAISQKMCGVNKRVNFKDFSRPNKGIKYFSRTLIEFKDFPKRPLNFKTFSRLYEPWIKCHFQTRARWSLKRR